jgi:tetratricopeptide (TPR) repeat protein
MAEENEPITGRKHRVIHWNPDATGAAPVHKRWTLKRIIGWSMGGILGFIALLFVLGGINRAVKMVNGTGIFPSQNTASITSNRDPNAAFVSETRAEFAHDTAAKGLAEIRRLPQNHPIQIEKLILIEKAYLAGEALLADHDYNGAYAHYEALNRDIDEFNRSIKAKQEAQLAYDTILVKIKDLELARSLVPEAFVAATTAAGSGHQFLADGSFLAAKKTLEDGLAELKRAETALADYVKGNLIRGQEALGKGQREIATKAFNAALEKAPGNDVALLGLKRAETIDRVYALLLQGESLEKQGQYAQAADSYQKAFALDGFSAVAQAGQARASRLEIETKFNTAFNAAQAAFTLKDWSKAIAECQNALAVYPQKSEVQAMLKSARENAHTDAVKKALAKGYTYENQYLWQEARDAYNETLQLEPNQTDAREGYIRTGQMIRTLLQYNKLIESAEQLASRAEFQAAIRRFNDAMAIKPAYLVNNDKVTQLHATLMNQNQPVEVSFVGDGKTWVQITNYRLLGQIDSLKVKILPGDYEIVGRRKGFKDVQMLLQVRNGSTPPLVTVSCQIPTAKS